MALPNPLPDNPLKWDGWRKYNSENPYERLCLDYASNAGDDVIEDNCRQLLVWWQKKLPLKNQPSNPMAQVLRQGLDEAPHFLAEARSMLLDPAVRAKVDATMRKGVVDSALAEFGKLITFSIAGKVLTTDAEERLLAAGAQLGLSTEDMLPAIEAELAATGSARFIPPPEPVAPTMPSTTADTFAAGGNPADDFRRILRMSRLCSDGGEMTDDQRDAMCNLGESHGLTGGQAEDLIDEYLDEMSGLPALPVAAPRPPSVKPAAPIPVKNENAPRPIILTPAARVAERQKYPNFVNGIGGEMYLVPSGRFTMGGDDAGAAPNESPLSTVTVGCFFIGRFPVTNEQYEKFAPGHLTKRGPWADGKHPVIYVSWNDAEAFCKWLSQRERKKYRLPTEAEWEFAARGEEKRTYPWGAELSAGNVANFADSRTNFVWREPTIDDGFAETSPVGNYPRGASSFGIEDMAGNVYEWCADWYGNYVGRDQTNPRGPAGGQKRVQRGGSWRCRAQSVRATARAANIPAFVSNDVGFRIVCECE